MNAKKKALGRGLNALLGDSNFDHKAAESYVSATPNIPIENIEANPYQPRTDFEEQSLNDLALSIKNQGIIQPITVRKISDNQFQLISGERRLRAAKIAGLTEIPAYIREVEDNDLLELALVENIQRENLNSIEVALSYQRLIEECNLTQDILSEKIGKSRSSIANYLRLLKLPPALQIGIRDNKISMGHARAIINVDDETKQIDLFHEIIDKDLSVRQIEELVRNLSMKKREKPVPKRMAVSSEVDTWKKDFSKKTNAKVMVKISPTGKGTISIGFKNANHLSEILKHIQ
jgi:ParB family transcriptional regulator, chromosome partitioning protein